LVVKTVLTTLVIWNSLPAEEIINGSRSYKTSASFNVVHGKREFLTCWDMIPNAMGEIRNSLQQASYRLASSPGFLHGHIQLAEGILNPKTPVP